MRAVFVTAKTHFELHVEERFYSFSPCMSPDGLIFKRLLLSEIRGQRKRFHIFAVSAAALFIAGDCSRGPTVEAILCKRVSAAFEPAEPTTRFNKNAERVYCTWA